jgi:prophage tail gpP-like protein
MVDLPEIVVTPSDTGTGSDAASPGSQPADAGTGAAQEAAAQAAPGGVPPNTSRFPDSEIATLIVNDTVFTDWESIWLQWCWGAEYAYFRFIAAERTPPPSDWTLLQFKPGDRCQVNLGGQIALTGVICKRQTSYDAERHQVQLVGISTTHWAYKSSVDTPTGSFDGQNLEQIYNNTLAQFEGQKKVIGLVNPLPFVKCQNEVGELTWDFLERLCKVRGAVLGADSLGNFLLIGTHTAPVLAKLEEGVNIKACECVIDETELMEYYQVDGHGAGSDANYGASMNELKCITPGTAPVYSKTITPAEQPVAGKPEVCDRSHNEAKWSEATKITATIVVYGWFMDTENKQLWTPGQNVYVDTPMAMLNQVMKIQCVTFEQDDQGGTHTTLQLVAPWMFNDNGNWDPGKPGVPQAPTADPASTPAPSAADTPVLSSGPGGIGSA